MDPNNYLDPLFEADAPKYFDFSKAEEDDAADVWFDNHYEPEDESELNKSVGIIKDHLRSLGIDIPPSSHSSENVENVPPPTAQKNNYSVIVEEKVIQISTATVSKTTETIKVVQNSSQNHRQPLQIATNVEKIETTTTKSQNVIQQKTRPAPRSVENSPRSSRKDNVRSDQKKPLQKICRSASADRGTVKDKLTVPLTPKLTTSSRVRSFSKDNVSNSNNETKNDGYVFKARPVPTKLLASPTVGVKKPKPKSPTKAVEPNFETDKRLAVRRSFRSKLLPPSGVQETTDKKLPEPKSAPIIVKKDAPITIKKDEVSKVTMVEPFSFQNREEQLLEKRKRVFEEGQKIKLAANFKANPAPKLSPDKLPEKHAKMATVAVPFHFLTDNKHLEYEKELREKLELEERARKKAAEFHACPAAVLNKEPFRPKHEIHRPIDFLEVDAFSLETAKRAEERKQFEEMVKVKESEKEADLNERRLMEERMEAEEVKQMRQNAVHKAQPVRKYKDIEGRPKPDCTVPNSPHFLTDERLKKRQKQ